jgi:hypothetical protein
VPRRKIRHIPVSAVIKILSIHPFYIWHGIWTVVSAAENYHLNRKGVADMRNISSLFGLVMWFGASSSAFATPSTELWTSGTTDIQPFGVTHIGIDNYFTVFRKSADGGGGFPTDAGITVGILPFSKVQMEVGIDLMEPLDFPLFFNAKIGVPEGGFFRGQPGVAAGIFNIGTKKDLTDYDITYAAIGKTIPVIGRIFFGGYIGKKTALAGEINRGITIAYDRAFLPSKSASCADFNRILLCADWASGKNYYGGGGVGLGWYFTENISILTGPVFFNDESLNSKWKWTTQLDINYKAW